MDAVDHRAEHKFAGKNHRPVQGIVHQEVQILGGLEPRGGDGEGGRLLEVVLSGGAPWGFTLKGGREHREPLLITKVEEGSKAASVRLQAGDEIVGINEVPLSGYRQEAICLVKGSHRTLTLVVKRRNEPASRPHSWHSTKFTESQSEAAKTQVTPTTVWHTRYDASSSSHDLSSSWDQTNLRRVSDQFSSLGSMDSLEHSSHPYPPGRLSPTKSNNSIDHLAGGGGGSKRDSAYSSFSTSSSTPDYPLSKSNAASTENMLYKVNQWESSGRHGNGRHSQSLSESGRTDERQGYLQLPPGTGGRESPRAEELPGTRYSSSGRSNIGPVWHVPEKKKRAPSPPPPPPPVRSDSFAATKVHEKGLAAPYLEGSGPNNPQKPPVRVGDWGPVEANDNLPKAHRVHERGSETRRSYNPPPKTESLPPHISMDTYNNNQLNSNKLYSLSSTDVRVGQPPYTAPHHQRQYSDESTFYPQPRSTSVPKQQNVGSYYSSMQELPTDVFNQNYNQAHVRTSSASLSSAPIDQNMESTGHSRYYCVTARQPAQTVSQASLVRVEGWKGSTGTESAAGLSERGSAAPQKGNKAKYPLPQPQQPYPDIKDSNGYFRLEGNHDRPASAAAAVQDVPVVKPGAEERGSQKSNNGYNVETHYMSYPPSKHDDLKKYGGVQPRDQPVELWVSEEDEKISPLKTPMLHSLAQESMGVPDMPADPQGSCVLDPLAAKQVRRSDRYATTLRNEIQMKRAQLQKSKSAATLTGPNEAEEDAEVWKAESTENSNSSSDGSFSSTYKDHLKEAQARVLRATSFRRRDLEPVLLELPGPDAPPGYSSSAVNPLPGCSEVPQNKASSASGSGGPHMSRIGGRKRFTQEQKVRSYSEPDKMNEVGVGEAQPHPKKVTSFADRRKFFEATSKTGFSKPAPRQTAFEEHGETRLARKPHPGETEESWHERRSRAASFGYECSLGALDEDKDEYDVSRKAADRYTMLEMQRLGTFAEYEATWNEQRKPSESRTTGRYHSADNILDAGAEECTKTSYVHERSRSSPSADFHGQNVPVQGRKTADYSQRDQKPAGFQNTDDEPSPASLSPGSTLCAQTSASTEQSAWLSVPDRLSDGGHRESRLDQKRPVSDQGSEPPRHPSYRPPPAELLLHGDAQSRDRAATLPGDLRHHDGEAPPGKDGGDVNPALPTRPEHQAAIDPGVRALGAPPEQPGPGPGPSSKKRGPVPQRPPPPKLDKYRRQETTSSLSDSSESLLGSQSARAARPRSPGPERPPGTPPPQAGPEEEQGAATRGNPPKPEPAPPPAPSLSPAPSSQGAGLPRSSMDGPRTPSPQFAPQRLTDKPPVSLQDEAPSRVENVTESNAVVKKVPIKIVHAESSLEKQSRQYLLHSVGRAGSPEGQDGPQVKTLGSSEQSYSLFCAYTRPGDAAPSEPPPPPGREGSLSAAQVSGNGVPGMTDSAEDDKKTEELAREIVGKDKSLADILNPSSRLKTTMDLMQGIFPQDDQLLEGAQQRRKVAPKQASPRATEEKKEDESLAASALVTSSSYYSTSAPKAELLIKMKDMQEQIEEQDSEDELDNDLSEKKELIDSISRKLQVLREARESLQEDVQANNALGDEVEAVVQQVCKPNEFDKFRMFIGDLDKVVSLLLSLSGRLARVENALNNLDDKASAEEKRTLMDKRKLLIRQHEDAKELKENLDRRERVVFDILASYLSEDNLADYEHFVKMKSALIIEQRKLEDKIKLGEEQLKCLTDSLPLDHRVPF
ncbi:protein Shroom2 isoform X2 [Amia ocellicauda]|uniref:protein Shroom2 isoform X2 n=1 Tax=Amia ocellicauda TaxID=2972642 RepID=UPI003463A3D8